MLILYAFKWITEYLVYRHAQDILLLYLSKNGYFHVVTEMMSENDNFISITQCDVTKLPHIIKYCESVKPII